MHGHLFSILAAVLLLAGRAGGAAAAGEPVLRIATGELPPYATASRADQGVALAIVRRAFELQGWRVHYTFLPWSRALRESRAGRWDGTAYWGRAAEREQGFLLSDVVLTEEWVFLYRQDSGFDWQVPADLRRWRMALIRDYTYTPEMRGLIEAGELKGDATPDDLTALRKLVRGRVDVVPVERHVACELVQRHFSQAQAEGLRAHPRPMTPRFTTHLMLPRQLPDSARRLAAFNRGLGQLRNSGEYERLRQAPRCPYAWGRAPAGGQ
ncbi:substrate-binding periplasmic protein [Eleftheria terrae]|uniref:substrate-binding periplasmic protein n=1 Tax=Eleftheria terrae TaxID=1597781 RepID=UPI00263B5AE5|nr:transporter substrate-binding domain-containing protein [Eleftheria terrae]WKB53610.1 transporter substrate-binding domain-containing protein [Eleftheria terrae]